MAIEDNPLELAYSCSICGRTASELYSNIDQNAGMHDGLGPNDRSFPMLWLTDCGHLICRYELPNKLLDFFREDEGPRLSSCPKCTQDGQPEKQINLFWIRDFKEGGFDVRLPTSYFVIPDFKKPKFRPEDRTSLSLQYHGLCNAGKVLTKRIEKSTHDLERSAKDIRRRKEENLQLKRKLTTHERQSRLPAPTASRISLAPTRPSTTALETSRPSKRPRYEQSTYFPHSQAPLAQAQAALLHPSKPRTAQNTLNKLSSCAPRSSPMTASPDGHLTSLPSTATDPTPGTLQRNRDLSSRDLMPPPPLPFSSPPPLSRNAKRLLPTSLPPQALFAPLDRSMLSPATSFRPPLAVSSPHFLQQRLGPVPYPHISRQIMPEQSGYDRGGYNTQWDPTSSEIDARESPRQLLQRIDTSPASSPSAGLRTNRL